MRKQFDMEDYIQRVCDPLDIKIVLAIGVGNKGPVAQHYWENVRKIDRGYLCDIWTIKPAPSVWIPLKMDALKLLEVLKPKSVDILQACGFLEHLTLKDAIKFLFDVAEVLTRKVVFLSCATTCHSHEGITGVDPLYKTKLDKNPYHEYKSIWSHQQLEAWGYKTNIKDILNCRFALNGEIEAWKILVDK